jgi:hypothetical protein
MGRYISAHFEETRGLLRRDGALSVLKYGANQNSRTQLLV